MATGSATTLEITTRVADGVTLVDLAGRINIGEPSDKLSAEFDHILAAGARKIVVNLSAVRAVDSTGISMIVKIFLALSQGGGKFALVGLEGRVHEAFRLTGLLGVIPHFPDEAAALASLR